MKAWKTVSLPMTASREGGILEELNARYEYLQRGSTLTNFGPVFDMFAEPLERLRGRQQVVLRMKGGMEELTL